MGMLQQVARRFGFNELVTATATQVGPRSPFTPDGVLSQVLWEDLMGLARQVTVSRKSAMALPVVSKARLMIAGNIGRLKLQQTKAGKPVPVVTSLLLQPEKDRPLAETLTWTVDALMFYPCTWWIVQERDYYGWPRWVKWLPQQDAELDQSGKLVKAWGQRVDPRDVIQFNSLAGGLLIDGKDVLQRATIIARAASLAEANPVPGLDLHNEGEELEPEEIEELLSSWAAARMNRGVGYSSKAIKVNPLGQQESQLLINGRKAIDLELARALGIPAWAVDVPVEGATLNYQNRASRWWELIDLAMAPYMNTLTARLSMPDVSPLGWEAGFVLDELTREDTKTRYANYQVGLNAGFLTLDMIYQWEGWDTSLIPAPKNEGAAQ